MRVRVDFPFSITARVPLSPSVFFLTFSGNKPSLLMDDSLGLLANLAPVERLIPASHLTTDRGLFPLKLLLRQSQRIETRL